VLTQTEIFRRLVRDQMQPVAVRLAPGASVGEAVKRIQDTAAYQALIVDGSGRPRGIITAQDVVRRIVWRVAPEQDVESVMSAPVITVADDDHLFQAVAVMRRRGLRHIPVADRAGSIVGMLALHDALGFLSHQTLSLIEQLTHEESLDGLKRIKAAQVELAAALFDDNVPAPEVQSLLTDINNDIHRRVLRLVAAKMVEDGWGEPPVPFALIVMGSGGRGESFLAPDQDNGFIIADHPEDARIRVDAYYRELAERMTRMLDAVGFPLCTGRVMATNPVWRKSVSDWRRQIDTWIRRRDEEMLLNCDIFFDFRHVFGDPALSSALRETVIALVPQNPQFLRDLFMIESDHAVALGWFGRLREESDGGDRRGLVNLKLRGTLPLVEGARLLGLKAGIAATSTLERLEGLERQGTINPADHDYLADAFHHITRLLLRQQIEDFRAGRPVDDFVPEARLSQHEKDHLVVCFRAIEKLRATLKLEFGELAH
jgi:signal-transduction protein with cAMP-binding, CBS, and nucleotidyltransferase domain